MAASVYQGGTSSANTSVGSVAVWEWLNEFSRWRPYEPHVATYIEKCFTGNTGPVYLGHADATLTHYILDFGTMSQIRQGTGKARNQGWSC